MAPSVQAKTTDSNGREEDDEGGHIESEKACTCRQQHSYSHTHAHSRLLLSQEHHLPAHISQTCGAAHLVCGHNAAGGFLVSFSKEEGLERCMRWHALARWVHTIHARLAASVLAMSLTHSDLMCVTVATHMQSEPGVTISSMCCVPDGWEE